MTPDSTRSRLQNGLKAVTFAGTRVLADLLILALWVVFLALLFLTTGWPRWVFYALLLAGAVLYVQATADWFDSRRRTDSN
ncbi:hypothetical protein [Natrononativus amylolyticus]|uniref:hypothetical protein n=1 Tax=Natrononativus amylolyticus TaxID=2963434 RepID=UPI0020CBD485|nr:hypothetical protein [Natrononativus amylolyticus]